MTCVTLGRVAPALNEGHSRKSVVNMMFFLIASLLIVHFGGSAQQEAKSSVQASEVTCNVNYMRIEVPRSVFNSSKYSDISLLDKSCKAYYSESKIILDSAPHLCGSKRIETEDHIIYQNEVYMTAVPTGKLVTREHDVRIAFSCHYDKSGYLSLESFKPQTIIDIKEAGFGKFQYHFKMYRDDSFAQEHVDYPIDATLSDKLFFEVNSTSNDGDLVILIDRCFATTAMDYSKDPFKYIFIEDRCPLESNVKFLKAGSKKQRFQMQAFSFIKEITTVYVHCVVFMCRKSSSSDACAAGCQGNNVNRLKREINGLNGKKSHSQYQLLDLGPLRRMRNAGQRGTNLPFLTIGLAVGLAVLGIIIAAMFVKIRKTKFSDARESASQRSKQVTVQCDDEKLL